MKDDLQQYYDIEKTTDIFSLNTGRVMNKIGINNSKRKVDKTVVTFVIIDNRPHLNKTGVQNMLKWSKKLIIATTNKNHPACNMDDNNLEILFYEKEIDFVNMFEKLGQDFGAKRLTVQSGGTLNSKLIRLGLIDILSIVVVPIIVGGKDTSTLVDGDSLQSMDDLQLIKQLRLISSKKLKDSYLHLKYQVLNQTNMNGSTLC